MFRKIRAFISLTRPPNGILMFMAVLAGVLLSDKKLIGFNDAILAFITAYALNGSSMGFNDYFDRHVDKVNAPWRPIPAGEITEQQAVVFSAALGIAGIVASSIISMSCLIVGALSYFAALIYNARVKQMGVLGNMLVSSVIMSPFIYGSIISDGYISLRLIFFLIPAYLSSLGREIIKGIADVEGDAIRGVKSIARERGSRPAAKLGAILYLLAVCISPIPYILDLVSWPYLMLVALADLGFIHSAISIIRDHGRENALKVKRMTLLWMMLALLAFMLGSVL